MTEGTGASARADFHASEQPALRIVTTPADASYSGKILGGWILTQADVAGSVPAVLRAGGAVATVAVNEFTFSAPVLIGDLVSFYACITRTGRTSITVDVRGCAQRLPDYATCVPIVQASLTYVAVDAANQPQRLPAR